MNTQVDCCQLQKAIEPILTDFAQHPEINILIERLRLELIFFAERLITDVVTTTLHDPEVLMKLKALAGRCAFRFKGFKPTSIRLMSGASLSIESPYFARVTSSLGRKRKKRKAKTGCHLGLSYLGFIGRCSSVLSSVAVQAALLCPSFDIAQKNLQSQGITMDKSNFPKSQREQSLTSGMSLSHFQGHYFP